MRRLMACLVALPLLCGCTYDYGAAYTANCALTQSQSINIARDIFRGLGLPPTLTIIGGRLDIRIGVPFPDRKPGETIDPHIGINETDKGLVLTIEDNGKGDSPLSKKMKDVIEQALLRNGCSTWKFDQQASSFSFAK